MTGKIIAILAAAVVLASAGVASAQPGRHARWQAPYADFTTTEITGRESKESRPIKRPVLTRMPGRSFRVLLRTDGGNVTASSQYVSEAASRTPLRRGAATRP